VKEKVLRAVLKGAICLALAAGLPAMADSLYRPQSYQPLTSDLRPRKVGDLITVMVYENSSASTSAGTNVGRAAGVGLDVRVPNGLTHGAGIRTQNDTDGHGSTQRAGRVLAQITVGIREIAANGDLLIAGSQVVDINNEQQNITLEGRVRQQDVSEANVVLSTRVAEARISYAGQGDVSERARPAWWQRLLTLFGV
jgi:flagellar L-ring protein precursor FlgH